MNYYKYNNKDIEYLSPEEFEEEKEFNDMDLSDILDFLDEKFRDGNPVEHLICDECCLIK